MSLRKKAICHKAALGLQRAKGLGILGGNNPKTVVDEAVIEDGTIRRTTTPWITAPRAAA
jgi:hypothetical protein